jgi:rare lipoprotein A (peptidoglycan hydrolase)
MRIAFAKHTLSFALAAALLGPAAALALPSAGALASTGGAAPTAGLPVGRTLATWFGPGFYGHTTACGQTMSPTLVGVASRTLACGTLVQFAYRGHELTVPVLDRGPYSRIGAVWDLTAGAARALRIRETVHVLAKVVGNTANTPTLGEAVEASPLSEASATTPAPAAPAVSGGAAAG